LVFSGGKCHVRHHVFVCAYPNFRSQKRENSFIRSKCKGCHLLLANGRSQFVDTPRE